MSLAQRETDLLQATESRALPPVSVIMPVYNGEQYIAEAIESVLRQTHEDFEFIIVNDGSTDNTQEIIHRYAARDGRIKVISQANAGQPASLNRALAAASNDWVAVLDADDVCMPHRLETQLRTLQREPLIRVLGAHAVYIDQRGRKLGIRDDGPKSVSEFKKLVEQNGQLTIVHPSAIMHHPTILALGGYDPDFGPAADTELWSRVSDEHVVISLPEPLLYYRIHPASMSVARFFEQQLMLRWIQARQHARRQGLPQPTLEEYRRSQGGRFTLRQLNYSRQDWGKHLLTRSGLAWQRGYRSRALLIRAVALTLVPLQVVNRTWGRKSRTTSPTRPSGFGPE